MKEDDLVKLISKENPRVKHIPTYQEIASYLKENVKENDLILTIGAGPVNQIAIIMLKDEKNA